MHFPTEDSMAHDAATRVENLFFTDVNGEDPDPNAADTVDYTPPNAETSSTIDSSEDEVIFNGRGGRSRSAGIRLDDSRVRTNDASTSVQVRTIEENTLVANASFTTGERLETISHAPITLRGVPGTQKKKRKPRRRIQQAFFAQNDDAAILADYVENMDSQYALPNSPTSDDMSTDQSEMSDEEEEVKSSKTTAFKQKHRGHSVFDQINSALAEEEEAAMGFQSDLSDDEANDSDVSVSLSDLVSYSQRRPPRVSRARDMTKRLPRTNTYDDFLDYESFADFDIMDFERDSLHRKKKKKKDRKLDFDLSDSDLEMQLQEGWENDRIKKKAKKQEREQLRAQGLLGKRSKLPLKSGTGITMEEVKMQVKSFLLSSADTLDLPPMDKKQRRLVHELANAVSLKSQSRGKGSTRYPVMYKTARTPNFNGKHMVKLDKILSQSRFAKQGNMRARHHDGEPGKAKKNTHRGKGNNIGYLDGDIVGGAAPEIGADNKGRAMLEKMGWSSGTALGATNNKGILQPVTQVMKNSRAGLG